MANPTDAEYYEKAHELYGVGGDIEIASPDETEAEQKTRIERCKSLDGEIGAYVKAWVFVPRSEFATPAVKQDELDLLFNPRPRQPRDILALDDSTPIFNLHPKRRIVVEPLVAVAGSHFAE